MKFVTQRSDSFWKKLIFWHEEGKFSLVSDEEFSTYSYKISYIKKFIYSSIIKRFCRLSHEFFSLLVDVILAYAGIFMWGFWEIPAFAGMTNKLSLLMLKHDLDSPTLILYLSERKFSTYSFEHESSRDCYMMLWVCYDIIDNSKLSFWTWSGISSRRRDSCLRRNDMKFWDSMSFFSLLCKRIDTKSTKSSDFVAANIIFWKSSHNI